MQPFNMGGVPPLAFGAGRLEDLANVVAVCGGGPVLIVADAFLAEIGVTARVADILEAGGVAADVAADVAGEPKEALVDALAARARAAEAKVVIGLGGGAAMDAAKLVAAIAPSGAPARQFALAANPLPQDGLPAIAIPTTAGTGSEVTRASVISSEDGTKLWCFGEELLFAHAVLDPELTLTLPPHLTAWTGVDAIAHALEAVTSRRSNPIGRLCGLEALRLMADALPRAVADGSDIATRSQVLWASMLAGLALHNCNVHMGHNISHALGSACRVHHGLVTGLGLEVALPWLVQRPGGAENYALAAQALGGPATAEDLPERFSGLMRAIRIPRSLPKACAGVSSETLSALMKDKANRGMAANAACRIASADFDEIAEMVTSLPPEA